jgi:DNA-binding NarL/FixJ family response regulator
MHFILLFNLKRVNEEIKQFISTVKKDSVLKSTPVFILSESGNDKDVMDLYNGHITNYILKPEDLDDLNCVLDSFKTFWFNLTELP